MTTRDHLVSHLQGLYSFTRDFLPLLDAMRHEGGNDRLKKLLEQAHDGLRVEMETLDRALNLLGAQYSAERSAVTPGFHEDAERFKHRLNPSQEQLDIHTALNLLKITQLVIGAYQGDIVLARAIGEQDVAMLLEENLQRERAGAHDLQEFIPKLVQEVSRSEARRAA